MAKRLVALAFLLTAAGAPQSVVSVMAGYLYQVEGEALVDGEPVAPQPQDLLHLRDGQRLETLNGRVEMMISPGSFLRIGPRSRVEMVNAGLLSMELRLLAGVAVVDMKDLLEAGAVVIQVQDQGRMEPLTDGIFRIDVPDKGPARVRALEGKAATLTADSKAAVKKGREIGLARGASPVKTASDKEPDVVDEWQTSRHKLLEEAAKTKGEHPEGLDPLEAEVLGMSWRRPG